MNSNVKNNGKSSLPTGSTLTPAALLPWLALVALMGVLQAIPDAPAWLRYDRAAIGAGEWWRLLTANFIHLGWGHYILNMAGFLAIAWLFATDYPVVQWGLILVVCGIVTSVGMYALNPEIGWCVGMSGALHGLFVAGAIAWMVAGDGLGKWLLVGVGAKLGYEQAVGSMPFSEGIVGGAVVTDAHLWGAIGGAVIGLALYLWRHNRPRL